MKNSSLFIIVLAVLSLSSCQKGESLKRVDDVCSKMEDVNFMKYCYDNYDVNKDGKVSIQEAESVIEMDIRWLDIYSLKGLEYFTNLQKLRCNGNNIAELRITNSKLLTLSCAQYKLTTLDVSKAVDLRELICKQTGLTKIDLSKNVNLEYLDCSESDLSSLDLSKNVHLRYLDFTYNYLSSLDLSNNTELFELDYAGLYYNPQCNDVWISPILPKL